MRVRFAPSPTGHLHIGNARVAIANLLHARAHGGHVLLRLDDTDAERSKPEYARAIEEDLRWLGLGWDSMLRQSDRLPLYERAAERLKASGRLYPCFETEEELAFKREQRRRQHKPPLYDRAALRMTPEQVERALANGKSPHWRFLLSGGPGSSGQLAGGQVEWRDGVLGERGVKLASLSDPVLVRADGSFLYTFTSVVDDIDTRITDVIRGEDHVTNTGIQIDLLAALGAHPRQIRFAHLPLLVDAEGEPLSKRQGSVSLRQFRRDGIEAAALAGYLAALGTSRDAAPGLPEDWSLRQVSRSPARFEHRALMALNRRHLHGLDFAAVRDRLPEGADEAFWQAVRGNLDTLREAADWLEVARGEIAPPPMPEDAALLREAAEALPPEPWDDATWGAWTAALAARTGRKGRALFLPLRRALTGEEHGPELKAFLPLIGRARAARRLAAAQGGVQGSAQGTAPGADPGADPADAPA